MNKEIEIRIQITDHDLSRLKDWLNKNAKSIGSVAQIDYYLNNPQTPFFYNSDVKGKDCDDYLRIRKTEKNHYLCFKKVHRNERGEYLYCDEHEVVVDDAEKTLQLMKSSGFTDITILEKQRDAYKYDVFEVAIDVVLDLGVFIEVELKKEVKECDIGHELIYSLLRQMGVIKFRLQPHGYVHQLWNPDLDLSREVCLG